MCKADAPHAPEQTRPHVSMPMHFHAGDQLLISPMNRLVVRQRTCMIIDREGLTASTGLHGAFMIRRWPLPRGVLAQCQNDRPSGLGFGPSLTGFISHRLPVATTNSDDGPNIPATDRTRRCFIEVGRGHRRSRPREGGIRHSSGQGCLWLDQCPPPHDQSKLPLNPRSKVD